MFDRISMDILYTKKFPLSRVFKKFFEKFFGEHFYVPRKYKLCLLLLGKPNYKYAYVRGGNARYTSRLTDIFGLDAVQLLLRFKA